MKKFLFMALAAFTLITLSQSCKKKLTDEGIAKNVTEQLSKMTDMKGAAVTVKDGVATITGECKDQACSDKCKKGLEDAKVDGVKSVEWKCTLAPPPPVSMTTTLDAPTMDKVKAGLKDMKGLTLAGFSGKGAIINGETSKEGKTKLMQMLASAKVLLDVASKITIK
jgi:hyperosmotically inducible periplasmic protein